MKNLQVGDVVKDNQGLEKRVFAITGELVALGFKTGIFSWYYQDALKDYTIVQPKQTLEEVLREELEALMRVDIGSVDATRVAVHQRAVHQRLEALTPPTK